MANEEQVTLGIRVEVDPQYCPERSTPRQGRWFFLYTICITNESDETCQLQSRHWIITDAMGETEEVRGPGVVGEQPVLEPGEAFEYTSGCPLATPFGTMEGRYQFVWASGDAFEAEIPRFVLREASAIH